MPDDIVLAFLAATAAQCVLAWETDPALREKARGVLDMAASAVTDTAWEDDDPTVYMATVTLLSHGWTTMRRVLPDTALRAILTLDEGPLPGLVLSAFERWIAAGQRSTHTVTDGNGRAAPDDNAPLSLPLIAIVAAATLDYVVPPQESVKPDAPQIVRNAHRMLTLIDDKRGRRVRVTLGALLRAHGLTTWPQIIRAVAAEWDVRVGMQLAATLAQTLDTLNVRVIEERRAHAKQLAEAATAAKAAAREAREAKQRNAAPIRELTAAAQAAQRDVVHATTRAAAAETERAKLARQLTDALNRAERAERELSALQATVTSVTLGTDERAERTHSGYPTTLRTSVIADSAQAEGDSAVQPCDLPSPVTSSDYPLDLFVGRHFLVFTGKPRGRELARIDAAFRALGAATVNVIDPHRSAGPAQYPSDALVVLDGSYVGHSHCYPIRDRAAKAGCWFLEGCFGATGIVRAVAERLRSEGKQGDKGGERSGDALRSYEDSPRPTAPGSV